MANEIPAVSVIVPMYNVEAYIGEMLESVLYQTLKNFELIIVYDRSNDRSREIVESYIPKFDGRLRLIRSAKNSGLPGTPRNKGLAASRGDYIYFMDSDDLITQSALEEMYTLAVQNQAEVLHCCNNYVTSGVGQKVYQNIILVDDKLCEQPVFIVEDLITRMNYYLGFKFRSTPGLRLLKRDFLVEKNINFIPIIQEDVDWSFRLICLTKKYLIVPNACYVVRMREGSVTRSSDSIARFVRKWAERVIIGTKLTDDFMRELDFFKIHPEFRYAILNFYATIDFNILARSLNDVQPHVIWEILKNEFSDEMGDKAELISYLFINNVMLTRELLDSKQKLAVASTAGAIK